MADVNGYPMSSDERLTYFLCGCCADAKKPALGGLLSGGADQRQVVVICCPIMVLVHWVVRCTGAGGVGAMYTWRGADVDGMGTGLYSGPVGWPICINIMAAAGSIGRRSDSGVGAQAASATADAKIKSLIASPLFGTQQLARSLGRSDRQSRWLDMPGSVAEDTTGPHRVPAF